MIKQLALVGSTALTALGLVSAPALGGPPAPLTLQESVTFADGPPQGTFTADGLPQCSSGTFTDYLVNFNFGGHRLVVDRVYTCDAGAGGFIARMVLRNEPADENGNSYPAGNWTILKAGGSLAGMQGTGTTTGVNSGCFPTGSLFFACQNGVSTVEASIV
jgi:hypothetical protein